MNLQTSIECILCSYRGIHRHQRVVYELNSFEKTCSSQPFFPIIDYSRSELIKTACYGMKTLHPNADNPRYSYETFCDLCKNVGKDKLLFSLHTSISDIFAHAANLASVLALDYKHWISEGHAASKVVGIKQMLS